MQLVIEAVTKSKSGKAQRVKAGNDWYGADLKAVFEKGSTIDAEIEDGEYGKWIKKFMRIDVTAPTAANIKPTGGNVAPWWAPFMSNVVAHAIASGAIKEPSQIDAWARAAMHSAVAVETDCPF